MTYHSLHLVDFGTTTLAGAETGAEVGVGADDGVGVGAGAEVGADTEADASALACSFQPLCSLSLRALHSAPICLSRLPGATPVVLSSSIRCFMNKL